ncbi:acetyltransferase [Acinetobacter johnsonii]|uniref:Acetyltransferase n=1 Tax=Acinetobacter johnsonii TaxID=40214 RepID=A0A3S9AQ16_ACIJO|nr:acyltransferase [Acinetobacter johnsonii]AZN65674.1 acetyltransferase [Acinetobacter johnsonii]
MIKKLKFWITCKRIGQDIPLTYPLLYLKFLNRYLCEKKFKKFGEGSEFRVGAYAVETNKISIGKYVTIRPGTMLFASPSASEEDTHILIEDYVLIGSGVHIYVSNHNYLSTETPIYFQGHSIVEPVKLSEGCWIGANCIILPGVTIGKNSVVGAGSIVTKSIPDFSVAVGSPAKVIRTIKK